MPTVIETTVYQFNELNDTAKERARTWYRRASEGDNWFSESVIEDASTIAAIIGIDVRQSPVKLMGGGTRLEPTIYWSGFASQGDGACFEGFYSYKPGSVAAVKAYAPQDTELHRIAEELQGIQAPFFYRLSATIKHRGHYYHEHSMEVSADYSGDDSRDIIEAESALSEAFSDFAHWIYRHLESEYEWINSDEVVNETIVANEYTFDEEGNRDG